MALQGYLLSFTQLGSAGSDASKSQSRQSSQSNYWSESKDYVKGGVQFDYPVGLFQKPPTLHVGITLKKLTYSTLLIMSHFVQEHDAEHSTIRVNIGNVVDGITEALLDDVTVSIFAVEAEA